MYSFFDNRSWLSSATFSDLKGSCEVVICGPYPIIIKRDFYRDSHGFLQWKCYKFYEETFKILLLLVYFWRAVFTLLFNVFKVVHIRISNLSLMGLKKVSEEEIFFFNCIKIIQDVIYNLSTYFQELLKISGFLDNSTHRKINKFIHRWTLLCSLRK